MTSEFKYTPIWKVIVRRWKLGCFVIKICFFSLLEHCRLMRIGSKKEGKQYKGIREGGINDNTAFYVFTHAAVSQKQMKKIRKKLLRYWKRKYETEKRRKEAWLN